jgi:acetyl-CoA acetyltransferase
MTTTPVALLRARLSHTSRRLRKLRRVEKALAQLQHHRRQLLAHAVVARPTIMYDSVDLAQIPGDAPAVAGYVGGHWPTYVQLARRFPHARRLSIAVNASEPAETLDVEAGDARPDQAPAWVRQQIARGVRRPVVYGAVSQMQEIVNLLTQAGLRRQDYRLWSAHFTGRPHVCGPACGFGMRELADATQYTDKALGRVLDESLTTAGFWT